MRGEEQLEAIRALVEPLLAEQEVELVELSCQALRGAAIIRVLVDAVGGITIRQCARVNLRISAALDEAKVIEGSYTLEVSSPGLDRPLAAKRDFERAIGEGVIVERQAGDRSVQGMLLAVQHEAIVLKTPAGNVTVPFAEIRSAKKAIRW